MALSQSRLDTQFPFEDAAQVQANLRGAMRAIEARLQGVEATRQDYEAAIDLINAVGLERINEVLLPQVQRIQDLASLGFLIARSSSAHNLVVNDKAFVIPEGVQRDLFTPSPYVVIERESSTEERMIASVNSYDKNLGYLSLTVLQSFGTAGTYTDWVISSTPGVTEVTRLNMIAAKAAQTAAESARSTATTRATQTTADRTQTGLDRTAAAASAADSATSSAGSAADRLAVATDRANLLRYARTKALIFS